MSTKNQGGSRGGKRDNSRSSLGKTSSRGPASSASRRSNPTRGKAAGSRSSQKRSTDAPNRAGRRTAGAGGRSGSTFSRNSARRGPGRGAPRRRLGQVYLSSERGFDQQDTGQHDTVGTEQQNMQQSLRGRRPTKFRGKEKFPELNAPSRPLRRAQRRFDDEPASHSGKPRRRPTSREDNSYDSYAPRSRESRPREGSRPGETSKFRSKNSSRRFDQDIAGIDNSAIYGRRAALEIIKHAPEKIDKIFVTEASAEWLKDNVKKRIKLPIVNLRVSNSDFISSLRHEGITFTAPHQDDDKIIHQGIAVRLNTKQFLPGFQLLENLEEVKTVLITMDIFDPGNLGAIIRSAAALGIENIAVCSSTRRDYARSTLGKASTGASEIVNLYGVKDLKSGIAKLKDAGFSICATDSSAKQDLSTFTVPDKSVILVGNEEKGLPNSIVSKCDHHVRVDLPGRVKSLNVAQATSILLWKWTCPN